MERFLAERFTAMETLKKRKPLPRPGRPETAFRAPFIQGEIGPPCRMMKPGDHFSFLSAIQLRRFGGRDLRGEGESVRQCTCRKQLPAWSESLQVFSGRLYPVTPRGQLDHGFNAGKLVPAIVLIFCCCASKSEHAAWGIGGHHIPIPKIAS